MRTLGRISKTTGVDPRSTASARTGSGRPLVMRTQLARARASTKHVEHHAHSAAIRVAKVRDNAIEAIDEAITRFRAALRATKQVVLADGSIVDEPVMLITPRDLAVLIDRFQILFGGPALITEGRSFAATIASEALPLEALQKIVDLTRGLAPRPDHTSALPRIREQLPD